MSIRDELMATIPDENGELHYNYDNWYKLAKEQTL